MMTLIGWVAFFVLFIYGMMEPEKASNAFYAMHKTFKPVFQKAGLLPDEAASEPAKSETNESVEAAPQTEPSTANSTKTPSPETQAPAEPVVAAAPTPVAESPAAVEPQSEAPKQHQTAAE